MSRSPEIVVAMSGGVDSAVAAARLLAEGCRVRGVSLRLWDPPDPDDPRICSNARDAAAVARHLGIPHEVLDRREAFGRQVLDPFARGYASGRTPNPCPACNSDFKLGLLLEREIARGAHLVATGHYARAVRRDGAVRLLRGRDRSRDQSYFLFGLGPAQLRRVRFPLGDMTKDEVRSEARRLGLPVADKESSQDLCIGSPAAFVASRGFGGRSGATVDESGRVLGGHAGVERFTIGQRRGLGIAGGRPLYVRRLEGSAARVVVGERPPAARALRARGWSWVAEPAAEGLTFQVRYRQPAVAGRLEPCGDGVHIAFDAPVLSVAPGQAVVAYHGEEVVGGGWIERTVEAET